MHMYFFSQAIAVSGIKDKSGLSRFRCMDTYCGILLPILVIQPELQQSYFVAADNYLILKGRFYMQDRLSQKIGFNPFDGIDTNHCLPAATEKNIRVELFHKPVQRKINDMFPILLCYGEGYFIF